MADNFVQRFAGTATGDKNAVHVPDTANATLVTLTDTQTMTNKTLASPNVTGATLTTATLTQPTHTLGYETVAAAGNAIGNATSITETSGGVIFATGADGTKGIILPVAAEGKYYKIKNADAANAVLKVYAVANSTINGIAANTAISMAANTAADFVAINTTAWVTFPLLPS